MQNIHIIKFVQNIPLMLQRVQSVFSFNFLALVGLLPTKEFVYYNDLFEKPQTENELNSSENANFPSPCCQQCLHRNTFLYADITEACALECTSVNFHHNAESGPFQSNSVHKYLQHIVDILKSFQLLCKFRPHNAPFVYFICSSPRSLWRGNGLHLLD